VKMIQKILTVIALLAAIIGVVVPLRSQEKKSPITNEALSSLSGFIGEWDCSGKFAASNKAIEAHLSFKYDLEGKWILFRHDDKPPFSYHALAEWGWDGARNELVMFVEDSGGGIRKFRAPAFKESQIVWTGDALLASGPEDQRFVFEIVDATHFQVSYSVLKNGFWKLVDSSNCSR
jgi:hypothetical protein